MIGVKRDLIGIDLGHRKLKLVWMNGLDVKKQVMVDMPDNALQNGRILSPAMLGALIRESLKENKIRCKSAAVVIPEESVIIRNVVVPKMQDKQLKYNLPFEFRDYIQGELRDYVFDYEFISEEKEENGRMRLLAVSMHTEALEELRSLIRYAGMRMYKAAPAVCAYEAVLINAKADDKVSCFIDIGYEHTRMLMFRGVHYLATDTLDSGLSRIIGEISESYGQDIHIAQTYLEKNFENCQDQERVREIYSDIFSEIQRALNFFEFNNPSEVLSKAWICGGGAMITGLVDLLKERLSLEVGTADELFGVKGATSEISMALPAAGITRN